LAVVLLIIQWSFKRFHFRYRHLKVLTEVAFLTCREREFQMAAPEYMNDLRKSLQLGLLATIACTPDHLSKSCSGNSICSSRER